MRGPGWEVPEDGRRSRNRRVSGVGAQSQISPKGSFSCFLRENIAILTSCCVQVATSCDFQQIGQRIGQFRAEIATRL